ncbi:MAG TPA: mechanosensitive ion channel [Segetibacter sp.]|jgi:small-conductance mechanosensitive channel
MDLDKAYDLIATKLSSWMREFIKLLPNIALAALILVLGVFVAKIIKRLSARIIRRVTHHEAVNNLFTSFIYILCIGITIFIALSVLQLDKAVTSILAGAGIAGLALAFAFQDIAANFMAGIFLTIMRPLKIGEIVKTKDYMGKVVTINLRDSVIRTFQGQLIIIPNKEIFTNSIENYSRSGRRRIDLKVGVSYGDDLEKVRRVALTAVKNMAMLIEDEPPRLFYEEFADSSINFTLQLWINATEQPGYLAARSEAIMLIKKAFDENNITIPFPIRTLDFGIKGGQSLAEMNHNKVLQSPM